MNTIKVWGALLIALATINTSVSRAQDLPCMHDSDGDGGGGGGVSSGFGVWGTAIGSNYWLWVGTELSAADKQWRIEKRRLPRVSLDPDFGNGGSVTTNPSAGSDIPRAVATDGSDFFVAGGDAAGPQLSPYEWRIERRSVLTGVLIPTFGNKGAVTSNQSIRPVWVNSIAIDDAFVYVAGADDQQRWRIEKRDIRTGALSPGFGVDGAITSREGQPLAIASDGHLLLVAGSTAESAGLVVERRNVDDGTLEAEPPQILQLDLKRGGQSVSAAGNLLYIAGGLDVEGDPKEVRLESKLGGFALGFASTTSIAAPGTDASATHGSAGGAADTRVPATALRLRARGDGNHGELDVYALPACGWTTISLQEESAHLP